MIILKVGGGKSINWDYIAKDLASLVLEEKVVLVHGANYERNKLARKLGHPVKTVVSPSGISSVYTDRKALEIFLMAYAGLVNKQVVVRLQKEGINAVGLSGVDGRLWQARRKANILVKEGKKTKLLGDNLTGRVEKINTGLIRLLLKNDFLPVICPPAISAEGEMVNVDNDLAVGCMARKLGAKSLIFLFEAPGFLKDSDNGKGLIARVKTRELDDYLKFAKGGMKKKVMGVKLALNAGVEKIYWGDGRIKDPIKKALAGCGTVIS